MNCGQTCTAATQQKYMRSLVLGWTWSIQLNSLRHSAHPSPEFRRGGKSAKFWLDFWHQSPMTLCGFKTEQHVGNLYSCSLSEDHWTSFWLRHFVDSSPNFHTGVKYLEIWPNFGLWSAVVSIRSNASKAWNQQWKRQSLLCLFFSSNFT